MKWANLARAISVDCPAFSYLVIQSESAVADDEGPLRRL